MTEQGERKPITGDEFLRKTAEVIRRRPTDSISATGEDKETEEVRYRRLGREVTAQRDYINTVDGLQNPPSVQAQREKAAEELAAERTRIQGELKDVQDRELKRLEDDAVAAATAAEDEKQKRITAEQSLQTQQNQMLLDKLDKLEKSNKPMEAQLDEYMAFAERIADKMGFQRVDAKAPTDNPQLALDLKKLELDEAERGRQWEYKMAEDKRAWDLKLIDINDNREFRKQELAIKEKTSQQLATLPQIIGAALASGMRDAPGAVSQQQAYQVEIPAGEGGVLPCPNPDCGAEVGFGPTTSAAQCVRCNTQFRVVRTEPPKEGA